MKLFHKSLTVCILTLGSTFAGSMASALTADELKAKIETDLSKAFSMAFIGPLEGASVEVSGDGPFEVLVSGGTLKGEAIPSIHFQVNDTAEAYQVENGRVDGTLSLPISGLAKLSIEGLAWSGPWSKSQDDFMGYDFEIGSINIGSKKEGLFGLGLKGYSESMDLIDGSAWQVDSKIEQFTVKAHVPTGFGGRTLYDYNLSDLASARKIQPNDIKPPFTSFREIFNIALAEDFDLEDVPEREALMLAVVDFAFEYVESEAKGESSYASLVGQQDDGTMLMEQSQADVMQTVKSSIQNGVLTVATKSKQGSAMLQGSSNEPMMNFEYSVKEGQSTAKIDNFHLKQMKQALVEIIKTGNADPSAVSPTAVVTFLTSFGSLDFTGKSLGMQAKHPMFGDLISIAEVNFDAGFNVEEEDGALRRTFFDVNLNSTQVPIVALLNLPERTVPPQIGITYGLWYSPIPAFYDLVGDEKLNQLAGGDLDFFDFVAENEERVIQGISDLTVSPEFGFRLSGDGFDFSLDAFVELDLQYVEGAEPLPIISDGRILVRDLDGLKGHITSLAEDLDENMQMAVFGALGGIGFAESLAIPQDDGSLMFEVRMETPGELLINDFPVPLGG